jgi:hypothetical protein
MRMAAILVAAAPPRLRRRSGFCSRSARPRRTSRWTTFAPLWYPLGLGALTRVGFIVPHLRAIEESVWEERRADTDPDAPVTLAGSPPVKIGDRMLPRVDLEQVVRTMVTDHERLDPAGDRRALAHA